MIYDKEVRQTQRHVVDLLPVADYLIPGEELTAVMDHIQLDYERENIVLSDEDYTELANLVEGPIMRGYVFNWMTESEFATYLQKEYGTHIREEEIIKYWVAY